MLSEFAAATELRPPLYNLWKINDNSITNKTSSCKAVIKHRLSSFSGMFNKKRLHSICYWQLYYWESCFGLCWLSKLSKGVKTSRCLLYQLEAFPRHQLDAADRNACNDRKYILVQIQYMCAGRLVGACIIAVYRWTLTLAAARARPRSPKHQPLPRAPAPSPPALHAHVFLHGDVICNSARAQHGRRVTLR